MTPVNHNNKSKLLWKKFIVEKQQRRRMKENRPINVASLGETEKQSAFQNVRTPSHNSVSVVSVLASPARDSRIKSRQGC